ncbi:MAG: hypothetical protein A3I66_01305 [Burkholderiales bacterium RIFCSPLOWO2_02_FULL_57_36]|nr:MAG: hypothetical protein A3I66_01305 [Burkholderiales bacterium RIFCSPLOWO2_02_FULL_57_36]
MTFRNPMLRRAVASLPCQCCGVWGYSQAAHANFSQMGKGGGLKASDAALMALCADRPGIVGCHFKLDNYIGMTYEEAVQLTVKWIASTYMALIENGLLKVAK